MSFLSVFKDILHATEAAAAIAEPIIATFDPVIGALMLGATEAAIAVEGSITAPGAGAQKQAAVTASTNAAINVVNGILQSQGKQPLPANTGQAISQQVGVVVANLNGIAKAVSAQPAA